MKFVIPALVLLLLFAGCGKQLGKGEPGPAGPTGGQGSAGTPGEAGPQGPTGNPGQNALVSSGPIGQSIGSGLTACHHDYEFQSNHWLLVRHQGNGTGDQGAGSTGFNLWNVDILDFALISEQGNVTYCTLHFDKTVYTLKYTVNDTSNGHQGETGTIDLLTGIVH